MKLSRLSFVLAMVMFTHIVFAVPPSFDNNQFYGKVTWDVDATAPVKVSAVSGLILAESVIKSSNCTAELCTGTYGQDTDNILRITGAKDGDIIIFLVNKINAANSTYNSGSVTELNLSIVTIKAAPKVNDTPKINETKNESKTNTTANLTNTTYKNVTDVIIPNVTAPPVLGNCIQEWDCSSWSACLNNVQTRSCYQVDNCDVQLEQGLIASIVEMPKLPESQGCVSPSPSKPVPVPETPKPIVPKADKPIANCTDKLKNQDETGVDCGGKCKACASALMYYVGGAVVAIIIVVLLLFFLRRGPKMDQDTLGRLRSAYSGGENRGMSDEQITEKLKESGWDEKILKTFLKQK